MHRATLFRNALVGLYASIASLAVGSMVGGLATLLSAESVWVVQGLTVLGVLALVYSAVQLVRESVSSLHVLRQHEEQLKGD
jgi:threonine/homoserine/homoserine lactone efflux protein